MKKIIIGSTFFLCLTVLASAQDVVVIKKKGKETAEQPLIVIDGVITPNAKMDSIPPSNIESVNVLKGNAATVKYGAKGNKGVVEITSKNNHKAPSVNIDTNINLSIMIDGDNITINGQPADKNDPRLKIVGKPHLNINKKSKGKQFKIQDDVIELEPNDTLEGSDDVLDMMAPAVNKAFLGVITASNEKGAVINSISEGSPAQKAGLKEGDIISKINDKSVDGPNSLYDAVGAYKPDDKIDITYFRDGNEFKVSVVLAINKAVNNRNNNFNREFNFVPDQNFNFDLSPFKGLNGIMNPTLRKPKLGISVEDLEVGEGVKITDVAEGSAAEKAGLKKNDIIISINSNKVKDVDAIKVETNKAEEGSKLHFQVKRDKETKSIELVIPKKKKAANL